MHFVPIHFVDFDFLMHFISKGNQIGIIIVQNSYRIDRAVRIGGVVTTEFLPFVIFTTKLQRKFHDLFVIVPHSGVAKVDTIFGQVTFDFVQLVIGSVLVNSYNFV